MTKPDELDARIQRLEQAVSLLAKHVGGTGWNGPLQAVLDEINADLRRLVDTKPS